jgi:hypothetical protein
MTRLLFFIAAIGLLASCRSTRQIQTAISKKDSAAVVIVDPEKEDSLQMVKSLLYKVDSNYINYTSFSAKVNIDYKGGDGKKYDVNSNIRMYKDSAIWISANAMLGIEALRVLVTRDSIKLLDKLNKVYTARSIDYIQEVTKLPLDLYTLQDLIIGNAIFIDSNIVSYSIKPSETSFLSIGEWFKNLVTLNANNHLIHSKLDDINIGRSRTADLDYSDFENKKGPWFATKRRIIVAEKTRLDIQLDFKSYDFNPAVSFPFSVPKNYVRN